MQQWVELLTVTIQITINIEFIHLCIKKSHDSL